jgi:hypothetical protein
MIRSYRHHVVPHLHRASAGLLLSLALAPAAFAQSATGTIGGRVTDSSGGAVPGATLIATSEATGLPTETTSLTDGLFTVLGLQPGRYRIEARLAGFRTATQERVTVNIETRTTVNVMLDPGEVTETVVVEATSLVDRTSPAVGTVIDRQFLDYLPLNGRSFQTLLELTPGVVLTKPSITSPGQFSVNGQRGNANYFMVDGVSANVGTSVNAQFSQQAAGTLPGLTVTGGTNALVSVDALEEFKVQTSSYAPEFGRTPGGQVSLVTRSGTNRLTGSAYDYIRNDAFDANDWFNNRNGIEKLKLRQQQFGATLGGPLMLPGYDGRGRTFFFASYEGLRLTQPQDVTFAVVPSMEARARASGIVGELFNAFPLPNAPWQPGDPALTERYRVAVSFPSRFDATSVRLDQHLGGAVRIFGRVNHTPSSFNQRTFANGQNAFALDTTTATAGTTWNQGARTVHDTRLNVSRSRGLFEFDVLPVDGAAIPSLETLYPSFASRAASRLNVQLTAGMPFQSGRSPANFTIGKSLGNAQQQYNIVHTTTHLAGRHELKGGVDWRLLNPLSDFSTYGFGYVFSSVEQALATGAPTSATVQAFAPESRFDVSNLSLFLQDHWRANARLSLTYGFRYEVNPPPSGDPLLPYTFDGLDDPLTMTLAAPGTRFYETRRDNVAPRVGGAYVLSEARDVVLRGGFGVYYDLGTGTALRGYTGFPFNSFRSVPSPGPLPLADATLSPQPFNAHPPYAATFHVTDRSLRLPFTRQWNASIEKGFGRNQALSASYVGSQGRRLLKTEVFRNQAPNASLGTPAITQLNPSLFLTNSVVFLARNLSSSTYHAAQMQYQRRMHRGVQALVSYTLGRSTDNISDETASGIPTGGVPGFPVDADADFGPSDFDVRHNLVGSVTWDLPTPSGAMARGVFGGWGIDVIGRYRSAAPINVISQLVDPLNVATSRRVDLVPGVAPWITDPDVPGGQRLNRDAFAVPSVGRQGTLGRNALRGFPLRQVDASLRRTFGMWQDVRLQVRIDAFNVLNTPNFGDPVTSFSPSPLFGQATGMAVNQLGGTSSGVGLNRLYQVGRPRSLQASLRVVF